jgi:hypothetical protein
MTYDPAARYTEGYQDPNDPRLYPDVGLRAAWLLGALFVPIYRGGNRVMEPKPLPIIDGNRSHDRPIRTSTALKRVKKPPGDEPRGYNLIEALVEKPI